MKPTGTFGVRNAAHTVGRWSIPARTVTVGAASIDHARELVIGEAQRAAGVPPWKPYRRVSLEHTRAEKVSP
jgi:hypothetical protein